MNSPATPKLALCIPTYNRGAYIEQAIRSIAVQMPPSGVEIVVVDNHSTDDTPAIVARLQGEIGQLRYFKREVNVGADRNVIEAGDYSDSDYFWVFGSDDTMPTVATTMVTSTPPQRVVGTATRPTARSSARPRAGGRWN